MYLIDKFFFYLQVSLVYQMHEKQSSLKAYPKDNPKWLWVFYVEYCQQID